MKLTIDGNSIDFEIKQGSELLLINSRKERGVVNDKYTSENISLPEFVAKSAPTRVELVGIFQSVSAFESALHKLFNYAIIQPNAKTFRFYGETTTSFDLSVSGAIPDGINVNTNIKGSTIKAQIDFKIINNYG